MTKWKAGKNVFNGIKNSMGLIRKIGRKNKRLNKERKHLRRALKQIRKIRKNLKHLTRQINKALHESAAFDSFVYILCARISFV